MRHFIYAPTSAVCMKSVSFDIDDDKRLHNVSFAGGCNGNQKGISSLCEGKLVSEVIASLIGTTCGSKISSCPDQLAKSLKKAIAEMNGESGNGSTLPPAA